MAYAAWSVVAGEQPTAAKWNILGTNDASFNDGSGLAFTTNNVVPANALATTAISLGLASITSDFSTSSTSATQVTGLTTTVTIPSGGRKVRITGSLNAQNSGAPALSTMTIWDGTVGSGTQLQFGQVVHAAAANQDLIERSVVVTPSAGSKTYNIGYHVNGGTGTVKASATSPAFIFVEVL